MADFGEFYRCILSSFSRYPAIIHGDRVITYGELDQRTNQVARALMELGVGRDENVGIAEYNTPAFLETVAGAWKITCRAVTLNFRFKEWELKHVIEDAGMTTVVFNQDLAERMANLRPHLPGVRNYVIIGDRKVEGMYNYESLVSKQSTEPPRPPWEGFRDDDPVVLMYTGGTTGYPKGVVYTQDQALSGPLEAMLRNFSAGLRDLAESEGIFGGGRKEKVLSWLLTREATANMLDFAGRKAGPFLRRAPYPVLRALLGTTAFMGGGKVRMMLASPLMHAWAYNHALIGMLGGFTSIMLPSHTFDPAEMLHYMEKHRANVLVAVGDGQCRPMVEEMEKAEGEGRRYDLSSLRVILSSGMALSVDVKERLLRRIPHLVILDVLASTEGHYISITPYTAGSRLHKTVFKKSDMVKVVDEEGGEVGPGEVGEVAVVREHHGSSGYYRDPEKSRRTFRRIGDKVYIFTGDMAMLSEEGNIVLLGRGSGCINTGGEKVFPEEVEEVLNRHPAVELSGVTSVPHPRWGEAVTAVIQLKPGETVEEEELRDWCKERIADYKVPKYFLFVEELPRLITGKVHYREIKRMVMDKYELGEVGGKS